MIAQELMIGDWVYHSKHGNTQICVIDDKFGDDPEITIKSPNIKHKEGYEYGYCIDDLESVFPIQLTPEILEKNLPKHRFSDSDFIEYEEWYSEDKRIRVIKDSSGYFAKVEDEELLSTLAMGTANFVHEWQHILNHGKIEKEIVL